MKIGIVGYGDFGKFLEEIFQKYFDNFEIKIFSRSHKIDGVKFFELDEVLKSDYLFLSIPISKIGIFLEENYQKIGKETILVDIATVKLYPEKEIKKYNLKYLLTHPMFGPFSYKKIGEKLDGLRIVLTGTNLNQEEYLKIKKVLENKFKLKILEMTSDEHDKMLAETLFLTHLIAQTIVEAGYKRTEIDTISFGFLMDAVESVKNDKELFRDVYRFNPYAKEVVKNIRLSLIEVEKYLNSF